MKRGCLFFPQWFCIKSIQTSPTQSLAQKDDRLLSFLVLLKGVTAGRSSAAITAVAMVMASGPGDWLVLSPARPPRCHQLSRRLPYSPVHLVFGWNTGEHIAFCGTSWPFCRSFMTLMLIRTQSLGLVGKLKQCARLTKTIILVIGVRIIPFIFYLQRVYSDCLRAQGKYLAHDWEVKRTVQHVFDV